MTTVGRIGACAALAALGIACAKASTNPDPQIDVPDSSNRIPAPPSSQDAGSEDAKAEGSATDAPPPGECEDTTSQSACTDCCGKAHNDGYVLFLASLFECMCQPSVCRTECTPSICPDTTTEPDATCKACVAQHEQDCKEPVTQGCSGSVKCLEFNECMVQSKCSSKPE